MADLFDTVSSDDDGSEPDIKRAKSPLAVRMRPRVIDEIVGQKHLLRPGSPLRVLSGE